MAVFSKYLLAAKNVPTVDVGAFTMTRTIAVAASDVALGDEVQFFELPCAMRIHDVKVQDSDATLVASAQLNRGGTRTPITAPFDALPGDVLEVNIDTDGVGSITMDVLARRK